MKGWHYTGESSSSSSNLSALAPPFTASPFAPNPSSNPYKPSLGLPSNSSPGSWLGPNPHFPAPDWPPSLTGREFSSMNYPSEHEYSTQAIVPAAAEPFSYGEFSDGLSTTVDEVRPYYPQYYYSRLEPDYPSGLTNQPGFDGLSDSKSQMRLDSLDNVGKTCGDTAKRELHEILKHEGGYCSEQENAADYYSYMNQGAGAPPSIGFGIHREASNDVNLLGRGKHDGPELQQTVDAKSLANNPMFTCMTSPTTLNLKYSPVLSAAHPEALSLDRFSDLRMDQMHHSNIDQKCTRLSGPGDRNCIDVFPALPTRPPASAPVFEVHCGNHSNGNAAGEHFSGSALCSVKETHATETSEGNILFDEAQIRFGQGRNCCSFGKLKDEHLQNEKVVPNDASTYPIRGNPTLEVPYMNAYGSNVSSFEAFNHFSHTVDSPCWKGVPMGHFSSSSGPSDIVPAKHLLEFKEFDGLNPQRHQVFAQNADSALNVSTQRHNEATLQSDENESSKRNLMFHQEQSWVFNPLATAESFHDAREADSPNIRQQNARINELTSGCSSEPKETKQNSSEHRVNNKEKKLSGNEGLDEGRNISADSNNGFSDVSFQCVEHVLSSPPPVMEATKQSKCYREELTPKIDVSMVVRMMHDLSKLLMFCSSNGTCDLKDQDCEFLKNATNNLIVFCIENRHLTNERNPQEPRITFMPEEVFLGELPGVHATLVEVKRKQMLIPPFVVGEKKHCVVPNYPEKSSSVVIGQSSVIRDDKMTQSREIEGPKVFNDSGKPEDMNNSEKHTCWPDQPCESSSDHSPPCVLPDSIRDDKMTQAVKTILAENFHEEKEAEPQVQLFKNLWLEAEAALCSMNYKARYDRMKFEMKKSESHSGRDPCKDAIAAQDLFNSGVLGNLSTENKLADDTSKSNLDTSVQSLYKVNDVMTRFNILKDRDSKSNLGSSLDNEEIMGPKVSCTLKDEIASEICKSPAIPAPVILPVKGLTHEADNLESSIFLRMSNLKQGEENLSSAVNPEPDLSQDLSGRSLVGRENSREASVRGSLLSTSKERADHLGASETEAKEPPEAVNLESSVPSRLSNLQRRDDNLSSMEWDCTPRNAVNLDSVVQIDYFPPDREKTVTPKDFSPIIINYTAPESQMTGYSDYLPPNRKKTVTPKDFSPIIINYTAPESQMTGYSESPMPVCFHDFRSSSDWEHVLEEEV